MCAGFETSGALLGHELAYCLGQTQDERALPILEGVLEDEQQHVMVRHEVRFPSSRALGHSSERPLTILAQAAEAIGAISSTRSLPLLERYLTHPDQSLRETCEIAVDKIKFDNSPAGAEARKSELYPTIDPAPPSSLPESLAGAKSSAPVDELERTLLDTQLPLFERYRAMFALRDEGSRESVLALARGFNDPSALFRHEIAYVFGQMCSTHSVEALTEVLERKDESDMVRHEAAEALGSIATDDCWATLRMFAGETRPIKGTQEVEVVPQVVRDSCIVALDMVEHERSGEFQYATALDSLGEQPPAAAASA